jgi:prevent-host-death family protein
MERIIGMAEAKSKLAELVGQVRFGGDRYILERRGQPMAVLIGVKEFEQLQAQASTAVAEHPAISAELWRRQETLLAQARSLRARFGPPEQRLAEFLADLPPEDDSFWAEVLEAS